MSKVRVLYLTPLFLPDVGGIETLIAKVLPILRQGDYDLIVVNSHDKRESFFRVGLFNTKWRRGIFNDWYLRATELGLRMHMLPDLLMWRRLNRSNHGIVNRDKSFDYVRMLKASLDRRRLQPADYDQFTLQFNE